ncbi:MAG: hypothetical protein M3381_15445, partial [Actinomycetota bacterium]|nr:hypothetical protein [Actinomycetota bacterium]
RALSVGLVGNCAKVLPVLVERGVAVDIVTDQTSAHDPLAYLPEDVDPDDWDDYARTKPEEFTDRAILDLFPDDERLHRWITAAGERVAFQGLPARICWLGYGERDRAGLRFNEMVAAGELAAPIVIGRDHLDCGSVASPYRETESMADGSDAIADWPLLNALLNTASGATWVSIHHGGGVGIGRSVHAGQVSVADGTPLAAQKLERVLTNDPGTGVMRHVDAGYERAEVVATERGVRVPMTES